MLGGLDDLLIVPLGVALGLAMTPVDVREEARVQADAASDKPVSRTAMLVIAAIWLALLLALGWAAWRRYG